MFNIKHAKLKSQLLALITISLVVMLIIESFYYIFLLKIIQKRAEVYAENILNQVMEKISYTSKQVIYSADVISSSRYTQLMLQEQDLTKKLEDIDIISDLIPYLITSDETINVLALTDLSGMQVSNRSITPNVLDYIEKKYDIYNKNIKSDNFTGVIKDNYSNNYFYAYVRTVFYAQENTVPNNKIGTLIALCNTLPLSKLMSKISMTSNSVFLILDADNRIIASNNDNEKTGSLISKNIQDLYINSSKVVIKDFRGKRSLIQVKTIDKLGWKAVSIIPFSEIQNDLQPVLKYGLIITMIIAIVLMALGFILYNNINRPINNIIKFITMEAYEHLHQRLDSNEKNEIGQLSVHINTMLDKIQSMTKRIVSTQSSLYEMELSKKQAELSALQSQINPHFLYNTLDCMRGIGYMLQSSDIVSITSSLSDIMRYSIKGGEIVSIDDEITCIRDYLNIISVRFRDKYTFSIDIDKNLKNLKILKFILQPIIENAIYHGLEPKYEGGSLKIKGTLKNNNHIHFEIYDNGKGISIEELQILNKRLNDVNPHSVLTGNQNRSIGLFNINSRIKFVYGVEYGIQIFSKENEGTTVIIEIPLITE